MKSTIITGLIVFAVIFGSYRIGYSKAESYYLYRIGETERALKDALQRSSQTLRELSATIEAGDDRDLVTLQEIINASPSTADQCRVAVDSLRSLDAISP